MTTDRTATPARNTASAQASQSGTRPANGKQSAPSDVFSTLLGAVAPKTDDAPRSQPRDRRIDNGFKPKDHAPKPKDDVKPADDAKPTDETTETEDEPKRARLVTPELFALQMASPLPQPAAEATPATPAVPVATPVTPEAQQPIPAFATQLPGVNGQPLVDANATATAAAQADVPATPAPATGTGGIPLTALAGLTAASATDPQAEALAAAAANAQPQTAKPADVPATPLPNATAQVQNPIANHAQPQTDAGTQGQPQPNPQAPVEAAKPADTPVQAQPTSTTPVVTAPAPTAPVIPLNAPTGLQRLVPLYKAPEMTATMIHIAAERGVTHARLNLKPVELGGIEVRLRTTPEGISAHLVADSPEAAKMLSQAADDLRRNLEARDVNLLSLDVSTQQQDQQQRNEQAAFGDEFGDGQAFGFAGGRRNGSRDDSGLTETPAVAETTLVLPNGVLVDVLA